MISIVVGIGYGDEGKGRVVDWLCSNVIDITKTLIIRFSGGQQVAHNVVCNKISHIHSNFGSGTLRGAATFWSEYCTFYPESFLSELEVLQSKGITIPKVYVHASCPLTTPLDIIVNCQLEEIRGKGRHGSCAMGVGATFKRHESLDSPHKIFVGDLRYPWILKQKLKNLAEFYLIDFDLESFISDCDITLKYITIVNDQDVNVLFTETYTYYNSDYIFEGSQGILLDRDHGIFPYCTRANTTSKNAMKLIAKYNLNSGDPIGTFYVSRCYATRHGAGPLEGEEYKLNIDTATETNSENEWQGQFRYAPLSFNALKYAIATDRLYNNSYTNLVITCLDQYKEEPIQVINEDGKLIEMETIAFLEHMHSIIKNTIGISQSVFASYSNEGKINWVTR